MQRLLYLVAFAAVLLVGTVEASTAEARPVPLYVYGVALVAVLSVAAVVYHIRRGADETEIGAGGDGDGRDDEDADDLPPDERVVRIVEDGGGRVKQQHVIEVTGWSASKVSRVTSRLEDDGRLTKLRMGRENILELED